MALHFYINGTTGAQDGVEISNGDLSNPLVFDGFYAASGVALSMTKTIHIRADAGETWNGVVVALVSDTQYPTKYYLAPRFSEGYQSTYICTVMLPIFPVLKDTNCPIDLTVYATGGESGSPDTTAKFMVIGGRKV